MKFIFPFLAIAIVTLALSCQKEQGRYFCTPCDLSCDTITFYKAGVCPHCKMDLIHESKLVRKQDLVLNEINIQNGSGVFLVADRNGSREKAIEIFYHRPEKFTKDSKILLVIPGAGRNADDYRDSWVEHSEKYNVLILSPRYEESDYPFEEYHLGGLIKNTNLPAVISFEDNSNVARLDESAFTFEFEADSKKWIFKDFDRVFDLVVNATNSSRSDYDVFGHSAGAQILHRSVLFNPDSKANKIIAANSGFYTMTAQSTPLPFGMKDTGKNDYRKIFNQQLIVLLGELDNENETGGTLLRSPTVDRQGLHRLSRGGHFFETAFMYASENNIKFNWQFYVVPEVGHEQTKMADAAARLLYESN